MIPGNDSKDTSPRRLKERKAGGQTPAHRKVRFSGPGGHWMSAPGRMMLDMDAATLTTNFDRLLIHRGPYLAGPEPQPYDWIPVYPQALALLLECSHTGRHWLNVTDSPGRAYRHHHAGKQVVGLVPDRGDFEVLRKAILGSPELAAELCVICRLARKTPEGRAAGYEAPLAAPPPPSPPPRSGALRVPPGGQETARSARESRLGPAVPETAPLPFDAPLAAKALPERHFEMSAWKGQECCAQAKRVPCACQLRTDCPVHGIRHYGKHD